MQTLPVQNRPGCIAVLAYKCIDFGHLLAGRRVVQRVPASPGQDMPLLCSSWRWRQKPYGCLSPLPAAGQPVCPHWWWLWCIVTHTRVASSGSRSGCDATMCMQALCASPAVVGHANPHSGREVSGVGAVHPAGESTVPELSVLKLSPAFVRTQFGAVCANHCPQAISEPSANCIYCRR